MCGCVGLVIDHILICKFPSLISHFPTSIWPEHVKARVRDTYMYFGGGLGITAASAAACFQSPAIMNIVTKNGFLAIAGKKLEE